MLIEEALLSFGKVIGIIGATDSVSFLWFIDPLNNSVNGISTNRAALLAMVQALLDKPKGTPATDFVAASNTIWEPIPIIPGNLEAGLVWNTVGLPLQLGVGVKVGAGTGNQRLDLALLARLLAFTTTGPFPKQISTEFGQAQMIGVLPRPDFLDSANITATIDPDAADVFDLNLNVGAQNETRDFQIPNDQIVWDCARLAITILRAWINDQTTGNPTNFFDRIDSHFFPMLGTTAGGPIGPFPLISDPTGKVPDFTDWQDSVLTMDNDGAGALTFLWHLRALITGSDSKDVFTGSYFFPLVGNEQPNLPPLPFGGFKNAGPYAGTLHPNSIFIGITSTNDLVLDFHNSLGATKRLPIGNLTSGNFTRPVLPTGPLYQSLVDFAKTLDQVQAGDSIIDVKDDNGALAVTLFKRTENSLGVGNGIYSLQLMLRAGDPIAFRVQTPLLDLEFPPEVSVDDAAVLFVNLLTWILSVAGAPDPKIKAIIDALLAIVTSALKTQGIHDVFPLLQSMLAAAGSQAALSIGPLSIGVTPTAIVPALTFGPFEPGDLNLPIHLGKIVVAAGVKTSNGNLESAAISLYDIRFGEGGGAGSGGGGLIASLLPDMRKAPGFSLAVTVDPAKPLGFTITGGGKIPLQETIGPIELSGLLIDLKEDRFLVGVDLSFQLSVIRVDAYELGIEFPFSGTPTPFLHGLGLTMDIPAVKLAGMFAKIQNGDQEDYVGGAVVRVLDLFQLSAIGGYTQIKVPGQDDTPSLFIFASLVAPLGGPPWFFLTGIAGGFGYNRTLPPPGLLTKHPFIQVMRGDLPMTGGTGESLAMLGTYFAAVKGQHWVAAGIQFTAFGFINGKLVVAIAFGNEFSISVLGLAAFGIENIAYFELGIEASGNKEVFKLKAGLSENSYLIHPDIARITGDFALGIWHGGEFAGDFVLSIGGYHPYFKKPAHYDDLNRVSVRCSVFGFVKLTVECFFACTPQALMAGASVSLSAEFAGIGVGLDVYIDVFIQWDPFFIMARMGIALWFEFLGRHEISVDLEIWTPTFGGFAVIDLAIVSFKVDFGKPLKEPPPPELFQFITDHLQVPAKQDGAIAKVAAFNGEVEAGLFRVDFIAGRTTKPQADSAKQEGVGTAVPMATEFAFTAKTRLPLDKGEIPFPDLAAVTGEISVPLCERYGMPSKLSLAFTNLDLPPIVDTFLKDMFPAAHFGPKVEAAQSGARQAVADKDVSKPSLPLWDGYSIRCEAKLSPSPIAITAMGFEDSIGVGEEYPLPLSLPTGAPPPGNLTKTQLSFGVSQSYPLVKAAGKSLTSRQSASLLVKSAVPLPLKVRVLSGDCQRFAMSAIPRGLTVAAPGADVPVIAVPLSPPRRAELLPVSLRMVAPKATTDLRRRRLNRHTKARNFSQRDLTPTEGTLKAFSAGISVAPGAVQIVELEGSLIKSQKLTFAGVQTVRAVFMGAGGDFVSQAIVKGQGSVVTPPQVRRIAFFGEGVHPAIAAGVGAPLPFTQENVGIEHDTTLTALGNRTFAAHGCILQTRSRNRFTAAPLDAVPGFEVLRSATRFTIDFPTAGPTASLILTVAPVGSDPGSALDQVRWFSVNAMLADLNTIVGPDSTALVMSVEARGPWSVEVDLGDKWRLIQVVQCRQSSRDMVNRLKTRIDQDLVDDRFYKGAETLPASSVRLEVAQ